jgi:beta-aspartyl-peptidase (threonine type)
MRALVIHGGAGVVLARLAESDRAAYDESLGRIVDAGFEVLDKGGMSLDAVTTAVRLLEDDPLFNAGRGAGLTRQRDAELDAAVMDGRDQRAGAVACVTHIKNPVDLARRVMERSAHVLLMGTGAEEFALEEGMALMPNTYFRTPQRLAHVDSLQRGEKAPDVVPATQGTVGAVALDAAGNLAAATSTGGLTNRLPGRVGDTPIVGAGTYAKNGVCGVSATGEGEFFIRSVAAYHIAAAVEYRGLSLRDAVSELVHRILPGLGGLGGIIAVGADGTIVTDFNTQGMFRAERDSSGRRVVAIAKPSP